jgi:hypothetical protein
MAKKKNADQETAGATPAADAKSSGAAAGKTDPVAATTPVAPRAPAKKKIPKLAKKNKSRLPRKQKKALQKAATRQ